MSTADMFAVASEACNMYRSKDPCHMHGIVTGLCTCMADQDRTCTQELQLMGPGHHSHGGMTVATGQDVMA